MQLPQARPGTGVREEVGAEPGKADRGWADREWADRELAILPSLSLGLGALKSGPSGARFVPPGKHAETQNLTCVKMLASPDQLGFRRLRDNRAPAATEGAVREAVFHK